LSTTIENRRKGRGGSKMIADIKQLHEVLNAERLPKYWRRICPKWFDFIPNWEKAIEEIAA
jgi:hypothetical protein